MLPRGLFVLLLALSAFSAVNFSPAEKAAIDTVSADSLKAHVSFLASDALEGRDTPSKGLEVAGEYLAAQFRRLRLEPAGDNGTFFQVAPYEKITPVTEGLEIELISQGKSLKLAAKDVAVVASSAAAITAAPVLKLDPSDDAAVQAALAAGLQGKAVFLDTAAIMNAPAEERMPRMRRAMASRGKLAAAGPALLLSPAFGMRESSTLREAGAEGSGVPAAQIFLADATSLLRGPDSVTLNAKIPAPQVEKVDLRNVAAILRGSDPKLKETYLLVSAHYDHIGVARAGDGDRIRNGANDDASGTAAVVEVAEAIVRSGQRPKRSIVFLCYFGEEKGLFGSRYYARRPMFPLKQTVGNLNLEQLGRVDDTNGDRTGKLTASGFTYTSMGDVLREQSARVGIEAWNDEKNSEAFFPRSDNQALADAGVPAITLCVAWTFPDYHRPGDHWEKLDYPNLERVTRAITLTALSIANNDKAPTWVDNGKTTRYVEAARKLAAQ
jgi:hypothetical protein